MSGDPRTMQADPRYDDVVDQVRRFLADRVAEANKRGLDDMMALAQEWGVPIPESLFRRKSA